MRKCIKKDAIIPPSSQALHLFLNDADLLINSLQASSIGIYMPPGPSYNEREKRYALTVLNTVGCFSVDRNYFIIKDVLDEMR
jgi:hypothetical protein